MPSFPTTHRSIRGLALSDVALPTPQPIILDPSDVKVCVEGGRVVHRLAGPPQGNADWDAVAALAPWLRHGYRMAPAVASFIVKETGKGALPAGTGVFGVDPGLNLGVAATFNGFHYVHVTGLPAFHRKDGPREVFGYSQDWDRDGRFDPTAQRFTIEDARAAGLRLFARLRLLRRAHANRFGLPESAVGFSHGFIEAWQDLDARAFVNARANPSFWVRTVALEGLFVGLAELLVQGDRPVRPSPSAYRATDVVRTVLTPAVRATTTLVDRDVDDLAPGGRLKPRSWRTLDPTLRHYRNTTELKADRAVRDYEPALFALGWALLGEGTSDQAAAA